MEKISVRSLSRAALIAAAYTVLSVATAPISFGAVQARIAEALTLLPVLMPEGVAGVAVGCLLTNMWGVASGSNILGAADIVIGTAATLCVAVCTRRLRSHPLLAALPPVLFNAVAVGGELMFAECGGVSAALWLVNGAYIALGQAFACYVLGLPLLHMLRRAVRTA